jgi:hypothetical protein
MDTCLRWYDELRDFIGPVIGLRRLCDPALVD